MTRPATRPPASDLLAALREGSASLSQAQRQVAAAMLDDPEFALRANVDALAKRAHVSPPTITRFCRALGYAGLREFKLRLAHALAVGKPALHRTVKGGDDMQTVTHKVLQDALSALRRELAPDLTSREDILAEELRLAARALGRLTGRVDVDDVLDVIFRDFCIGK